MGRSDLRQRAVSWASFMALVAWCLLAGATGMCWALDRCPGIEVADIRMRGQHKHELSLIFYHVAWCINSRAARAVFVDVAQIYRDFAYFAEVDCWHLGCNCSHIYESPDDVGLSPRPWPTLVAYYGRRQALFYSGEWNLVSLSRYMEMLIMPLKRVHSRDELKLLNMRNDVVLLALFSDIDSQATIYEAYIQAAVQWLEVDPKRGFCFAIASGVSALQMLDGARVPQIYLLDSQNHSLEAFPDRDFQINQIMRWTHLAWKRHYSELYAYNSPATITKKLCKGPVLVLLVAWTPQNFLAHIKKETTQQLCLPLPDMSQGNCVNNSTSLFYRCIFNNKIDQAALYAQRSMHCTRRETHTTELLLAIQKRKWVLFTNTPSSSTPPKMRIAIAKYLKMAIDALQPNVNSSLALLLLDAHEYRDVLTTNSKTLAPQTLANAFIADSKQ